MNHGRKTVLGEHLSFLSSDPFTTLFYIISEIKWIGPLRLSFSVFKFFADKSQERSEEIPSAFLLYWVNKLVTGYAMLYSSSHPIHLWDIRIFLSLNFQINFLCDWSDLTRSMGSLTTLNQSGLHPLGDPYFSKSTKL